MAWGRTPFDFIALRWIGLGRKFGKVGSKWIGLNWVAIARWAKCIALLGFTRRGVVWFGLVWGEFGSVVQVKVWSWYDFISVH